MTPPPAASHAAQPGQIALPRAARARSAVLLARLLDARSWARLRLLVDVVVLYLAASAALFGVQTIQGTPGSRWIAAAFPLLALALLHVRRTPDERLAGSMLDTATHVAGVVSLGAMLAIAIGAIAAIPHPVGLAVRLWLFSAVYLGVARVVLLSARRQAMRVEALATPTLIVGAGVVGDHLVRRLALEPRYGLRPVGFIDSDPLPSESRHRDQELVPVLGGIADLTDAIEQTGARHVILAFSSEPDQALVAKVGECQERGVAVSLVPRLFESINQRSVLDHIGGLPVLSLRPTDPRGWQFAVKHAFDRSFAGLAVLALAPVMIAIAIIVRLSSPGPALFRQRRVGRDGRAFDLLKFRTMRQPVASVAFSPVEGCAPGGIEGVDRRTSLGRFLRESCLDELPQLLNVLRGEMSLVGPRPERPQFVEQFTTEVTGYQDRHRVRSGMTGWAQVHGLRGQTSIEDRVEWDKYYIQNWSLRLDFHILLMTVVEVLRRRG